MSRNHFLQGRIKFKVFRFLFLMCVLFLSFLQKAYSQDLLYSGETASLYTGQYVTLVLNAPTGGIIDSYAFSNSSGYIEIHGDNAIVNGYFSGTETITCTYAYHRGTTKYTNQKAYYYIKAKSVSITLNKSTLSLSPNEEFQLSYTVQQTDAPSPEIKWESSNETVATVVDGLVRAKNVGTAIVTAKNNSGSNAVCNVTVSGTGTGTETDIVTIGDNSSNSGYVVPYGNYYQYSSTQMLYTPTEIGKSGKVKSMAFKVANASSFATSEMKVYLGHKSGTFSSQNDYVGSGNLTLVYDGTPTLGQATGWETITFNKASFTYNGTDNLVIVITRKSSKYNSNLKYFYFSDSGYTLYRWSDDYTGYGDITNTSYPYSSSSTNRPVVKLEFDSSQTTLPQNDGDTFVANTEEGVEMTFKIISASNNTCQVGIGKSGESAIDKSTSGMITIPDKVFGYTVTTIGSYAFEDCNSISSVNIPQSVNNIDSYAFSYCSGLKSIVIPGRVEIIKSHSFQYTSGLTSVIIEEGVKTIQEYAFYTSGLQSIVIPSSVSSIGESAFVNCRSLKTITSYIKEPFDLGDNVFAIFRLRPTGLIPINATLYVPFGTKSKYEQKTGWNNLDIIEQDPHDGDIFTSKTVEGIEMTFKVISAVSKTCMAGTDSSSIRAITTDTSGTISIPNIANGMNVKRIGEYAFWYCSNLTSINIPTSVISIGSYAFQHCSGLTHVTIPYSVDNIDIGVFSGCIGLTGITVENGNANYDSRDECNAIIETSSNTLIAGCKNTVIPTSVTSIGNSAFSNMSNINGISIPNSVISIGNRAFDNCKGLTSITIPSYVISIGQEAFKKCEGLTSITIPNSVKDIGSYAFYDCKGLQQIISEIKEPFQIDKKVFQYGKALVIRMVYYPLTATLYVPYGTKSKYMATEGWNQLTIVEMEPVAIENITLPENMQMIIGETQPLTPVVIPENATSGMTWTSENEEVATVDENGIVTAVGKGTTVIYCISDDDEHAAFCQVKVYEKGDVNGNGDVNEVDAQQILDVSVGLLKIDDLIVPKAVNVPGGNDKALEVNAQKVLDYSVAKVKPW